MLTFKLSEFCFKNIDNYDVLTIHICFEGNRNILGHINTIYFSIIKLKTSL